MQRYKLIIEKEQIDIVIVCFYQVIGLVMRSLEFYKMNKNLSNFFRCLHTLSIYNNFASGEVEQVLFYFLQYILIFTTII